MARRRAKAPSSSLAAVVATLGVWVFGAVVFLTIQQMRHDGGHLPAAPAGDWEQRFQGRLDGVTARLEHGLVPLPAPVARLQGSGAVRWTHRGYEVALAREASPKLRAALELARGDDAAIGLSVAEEGDGLKADFGVDGLLTHTVVARWVVAAPRPAPRLAVVIDDLGNDLLAARELVALEIPVTLAIIPLRPFSREVGELARLFDREVLLHLPMEAEGGEEHGEGILLRVTAGRDEIIRQVDRSLAAVPYIIGVSNHMGSRFTEDRERMRWVLERVRQHRLFFLDSLTSPRSVGQEVAAAVDVPCMARTVFLDDPVSEASIEQRVMDLIEAARRRGYAIGIGHPHKETISALRALGEKARAQGVEVVALSTLVPHG